MTTEGPRSRGDAARAVVTGMGIACAVGSDLRTFEAALRQARSGVAAAVDTPGWPATAAALLTDFEFLRALQDRAPRLSAPRLQQARRLGRRASLGIQATIVAALDAWSSAGLDDASTHDMGIVVAGSNLARGHAMRLAGRYADRPTNITPRYCVELFDTDHVGVLSELLGVHGEGLTVGGACASGNTGIRHGLRRVRGGEGPTLVVGAMMDLSSAELHSFRNAGALIDLEPSPGHERAAPATGLCRPFDRDRRGFAYGQGAACLVLEPLAHARARGARVWGEVAGASSVLEGTAGPAPRVDGQARAMQQALADAGLSPADIDYVNAHATASRLGDEVELQSLERVFATPHAPSPRPGPWINSTKALVGHTLTAAGVVEAVATLLQMAGGFVHANPFLEAPLRPDSALAPGLVGRQPQKTPIHRALSNSFGFGGISTSVVLTGIVEHR